MKGKQDNEKLLKRAMSVNILYKQVFETPEGKEVLKDLIESCGLMSFGATTDPQVLAFREGQREVVSRIIQAVQMDIDTYLKHLENIRDLNKELFE